MCKFASEDEQKYRPVWMAVKYFVETLGMYNTDQCQRLVYDQQSHLSLSLCFGDWGGGVLAHWLVLTMSSRSSYLPGPPLHREGSGF